MTRSVFLGHWSLYDISVSCLEAVVHCESKCKDIASLFCNSNWEAEAEAEAEATRMINLAWMENAVAKLFRKFRERNCCLENDENASPAKASQEVILTLTGSFRSIAVYAFNLSLSNRDLFESVESYLAEQELCKIDDVQKWVDNYFISEQQSFYHEVIRKLPDKNQRCIELINTDSESFSIALALGSKHVRVPNFIKVYEKLGQEAER